MLTCMARMLLRIRRTRAPVDIDTMTTIAARLRNFGPNWFASVMGTGIVATAGATLPIHVPGLHVFSRVVWVVAAVLLVVLVVAVTVQWIRHPTVARSHSHNPQMAHFYGAAPMALLTVGLGGDPDRQGSHRRCASPSTSTGCCGPRARSGGLFTAATIPYLMFTQLNVEPDAAFGGWLMPVVPPMVSAAAGALLIPHMQPGTGRTTMLYGCYAMFGLSLIAALIIISMIWSRLALYGTSGTARVPTLWIVLGPLGQGITAAGLLGTNGALAVPPELANGDERSSRSCSACRCGASRCCGSCWPPQLTVRTAAARHALRADVVEPDVPGRHLRHRAPRSWPSTPGCPRSGSPPSSPTPGCCAPGGWSPCAPPAAASAAACSRRLPQRPGPIKAKKDQPVAIRAKRGVPRVAVGSGGQTATRSYCFIDGPAPGRYSLVEKFLYASRMAVTPWPPAAQIEISPRTGLPVLQPSSPPIAWRAGRRCGRRSRRTGVPPPATSR